MATFKIVTLPGELHKKSDGTKNIKIRIYHNKSIQYISTIYYIEESFLGKDGVVNQLYPNADILNFELGELIQQYRGSIIKLGVNRLNLMSCKEIREQIVASLETDYEFIDFVEFSRKIIDKTTKPKTKSWYQEAVNVLCWFYEREKIDIRDITTNRLNELKEKLLVAGRSEEPLSAGAISNYLRGIRALFNKAKLHFNNEDYNIIRVTNNPFARFEAPKYKKKRKSISIEDIIKIRAIEVTKKRTILAQDMFLTMFYLMGININDLYNLNPPKHGRIEYERSKTDTDDNDMFPLSIKIEPELQVLFDKYSEGSFLSVIKDTYCNSDGLMKAINIGLKEICTELRIPKVTTNWARHSWASIARNKAGIAKADIDFCLGHVNNDYKMADIYIDIDYGIYDKANRKVLDLLKEESEKTNKKTEKELQM